MKLHTRWFSPFLIVVFACSGSEQGAGNGDDDDDDDSSTPSKPSPGPGQESDGGGVSASGKKRVFVTSVRYTGDLGGLTGADAKCATAATAALLDGTWRAWIADGTTDAADRIDDVGPWYTVDGKIKMFNNKANLSTTPLAPDSWQDEQDDTISSDSWIWTGTDETTKAGTHCGNWTNGSSGSSGMVMSTSTSTMDTRNCAQKQSLLCIEQ